jgi:hypothetical protein
MRERLVKRYGKSYAQPYGWAAQVTMRKLGVQQPQWFHLERVAQLAQGHADRVKAAHHLVHVDALGVLELVDGHGTFHAGARLDEVPNVAWQTVRALSEATDSLLAIWQRHDPTPLALASRQLAAHVLLNLELIAMRSGMEPSRL